MNAEQALTEMYAVLNDSDRWHNHVKTIRNALQSHDEMVDVLRYYASLEEPMGFRARRVLAQANAGKVG